MEEPGHAEEHGGVGHAEEKEVKKGVFVVLLAAVVVGALLILRYSSAILDNILPVAIALIIVYLAARFQFLLRLNEYERAVIMRFGQVNRVGGPGWTTLFPPFETYKVVDLRAKTIDTPPQEVITKDGIEVKIDAVVYLKVNPDDQSVINSVVGVDDYVNASRLFVMGLIRNQAGTKTFDELITDVGELNTYLKKELEGLSQRWGVTVEEATITEIVPPEDVQAAREGQQIALQKKLARMESAEAHKAEIEAVRDAAGNLSDKALAYYYVKALEKLGEGQSSKIIFPMELTELAKSITHKQIPQQGIEALLRRYAPAIRKIALANEEARSAAKKERQKRRAKKK